VRTEVAHESFLSEHGREPVDARELAGQIAKDSRPRTQTVAGYDLTFSPVKSVSSLWAVAEPAVAAVIEQAHQAAVKDALAFIEQHAFPWLPGIPTALHDHLVWGQYLAKRSQLVTDLADRIRGYASQDDTQPVWAPPGSRPNAAIIGEVAVWRAASGIHPSDPRPTGGTQLETAPAIWKQRLDRDIARDTYHSADARGAEPGEGRSALSRYGNRQPSYLRPARRPSGPSAPGR
jgi:TrwC relaxase